MSDKRIFSIPEIIKDCIMTAVDIRLSYVKFLLSMDAGKDNFCLLSMDAGKGNFCYPWMNRRIVSAIHGCRTGKFLLSMNAAKGNFFYPWMQQREVSAIHKCRKG